MVSSKSHCISFLPSIVEPLYNFKYSIWKLLDVHFTGVWERCMVFAYAYVCKFKNYLVCSQNLKKKMFFRKFFQQMFQFYWVRQIFICIQSTPILACTLSTALALSLIRSICDIIITADHQSFSIACIDWMSNLCKTTTKLNQKNPCIFITKAMKKNEISYFSRNVAQQ